MKTGKGKIVVLGMLSRHPLAGMVWLTVQYLAGFQRLGYEPYYVEAHGGPPKNFMEGDDDGSLQAAEFLDRVMRDFGLEGRWAFQALHSDGRCYGMTHSQLRRLYRSSEILINLHGGTNPLPEHAETGRLVYLGTDPVAREIEVHQNVRKTIDLLEQHCSLFTWGENFGNPDCGVPQSERFRFIPTRQPILLDCWNSVDGGVGAAYTTVGSWRQMWRDVRLNGDTYHWSKHFEFLKFIDLPERTGERFVLALNGCDPKDRRLLKSKGWRVRDAASISHDAASYRRFILRSRGEFTVAKDQNVRLRSGWFSDRSACYLAAGRPVVTQETGFSNILPTGEGLFAFSTMEELADAFRKINADYRRHSRAARNVAREFFNYEVVLPRLLSDIGI